MSNQIQCFVSNCKPQLPTRKEERKEANILFNDPLNIFYLRLYAVGYMVKDHCDSEMENPQTSLGYS